MANALRRPNQVNSSHRAATEVQFQDQVQALKHLLGAKLMAMTIGVNPSTLERWLAGTTTPSLENEARVRTCYQVFELLKPVEESHTIRAWFMGMNPQLEDRSPAELIAEGDLREVLTAARAFRAGG